MWKNSRTYKGQIYFLFTFTYIQKIQINATTTKQKQDKQNDETIDKYFSKILWICVTSYDVPRALK